MITVLLADDHALVRRGFRRLLEDETDIEVVGEAGSGTEAIAAAERLQPQVIVMDYAMPELDGVQAAIEIRRRLPECAVLMLSMHSDENYIRNARKAGVSGYLLKNAIDVDLVAAVRSVAEGKPYGFPIADSEDDEKLKRLTPRERQILQLIAQGLSTREIALTLGLSVNTVAVHRANLMDALEIHRSAELIVFAMRKGLVSPT